MFEEILEFLTAVSGAIIVITTILTAFKRTRKWLKNLLFKDLETKIDNQHKELEQEINDQRADLSLKLRRLEVLNMIQHNPDEEQIICQLYDKYRAEGGNSYAVSQFEKWQEQYCKNN